MPKWCPESCSRKASSKAAPRIAAPHSCSRKLFKKLLPKAVPEICSPKSPKLPRSCSPQYQSWSPKLFPKMLPKITPQIIQSCCWKLFPKFLVNACPKVAGLQSKCCSSSSSSSSSRREKKYIGTSLNGYIANKNEKIKKEAHRHKSRWIVWKKKKKKMNPKKRYLWTKGKRVGSKGSRWKYKSGWGGPLQCVPRKNMKEVDRYKSIWTAIRIKWSQTNDDAYEKRKQSR